MFVLVLAWVIGRGRNKRKTVLLVGLSDAGKTLLFTRVGITINVAASTSPTLDFYI